MSSHFSSFLYKDVIPMGHSDDGSPMTATSQDIELFQVAFYNHQTIFTLITFTMLKIMY